MTPARTELRYREGRPSDLATTFELSERSLHEAARRQGVLPPDSEPDGAEIRARWGRQRGFLEFIAAHSTGTWWVCEDGDELVGCALVARLGGMDELSELRVKPSHHGLGVGRGLLERCLRRPPSAERGRVTVAAGAPVDLGLYTDFGFMPATGHWHLQARSERYLARRSSETDVTDAGAHVLEPARAVEEWRRLEHAAIGHDRVPLHEFFARTRSCLACMEEEGGRSSGLCWVSGDGDIGPAVGATAEDLVHVVLAALDRIAKLREPEHVGIFCTTQSWFLLRRLRGFGVRVLWPSWVMASLPLQGMDRYVPTRPPRLL